MKRWIVILLVCVLLGAGCKSSSTIDVAGGADGGAAPTVTPDESGDQAQAGDTEAQADDTSASDDAGGDDEPANQGASSFANSDDWCTVARAVETRFDEVDDVDFSDPAALEKAYTEALEIVKSAEFVAPDAIAADVKTTVAGLEAFVDALDAVEWSFLDLDLSILGGFAAELEVASFNIERYNFEECGIDNGFDPADDPALNPDSSGDLDFSTQGTLREQVIDSLVAEGFTPEEAACVADRIDITNPEMFADATSLLGVFAECGISVDRLGQLGG